MSWFKRKPKTSEFTVKLIVELKVDIPNDIPNDEDKLAVAANQVAQLLKEKSSNLLYQVSGEGSHGYILAKVTPLNIVNAEVNIFDDYDSSGWYEGQED